MHSASGGGSEYRLEIKIKNNLLYTKIMQFGYPSILKFCEEERVAYPTLIKLINMTESPLDSKGRFRDFVHSLCDKLNCLPEELFTQNQLDIELVTNKFTKTVQEAEMRFLIENAESQVMLEELVDKDRLVDELYGALDTLTPREQKVIKMRFGLEPYTETHTLREVAKQFDVTSERIRHIEAKALRKLRHPSLLLGRD